MTTQPIHSGSTGHTLKQAVTTRMSAAMIAKVEAWVPSHETSRLEAIRRLVGRKAKK
jgi:hypothetical protein